MRSRRILIVTNGPLSRNPRVVKEATTLAGAGARVTVLGVRNHAPSGASDAAIACRASFEHREVDLLAATAPWSSRVPILLRRLRIRLARDFARHLRLPSMAALGPDRALLAAARATTADLTVVHNEVPHWVGVRLLDEGRRVAADIEDWHSEDLLPDDRRGRPLALLRRVESQLLNRAAYVTTTSHALADALHARHGGNKPTVITNSFPLPVLPAASSPRHRPPSFFWFSQTTGPGRGLEAFLSAWARTSRPSRVVLLGEARGDYDRHLLSLVPGAMRARITFLPLVAPTELPALIAQHDLGLALEQRAIVNRDLTITNKILQYLGAGLAIVATPTAGQQEVLAHAPAAGVMLDFASPERDAVALDQLLADRAQLATRQRTARQLAESHYCWEIEAPRLLEVVARALAGPQPEARSA